MCSIRKISAAILWVVPFLFFAGASSAQSTIFVENFDYPAGSLLTDNGWTAHSAAGTNALTVVSPSLTYTGYPSSGVGNAVSMVTSGEDVHRTFTPQTSGSVYAAFMVNVSEAATDVVGGYFFHLGPDPISTTFRARVYIKKDASNNIAFGLSKAGASEATTNYTGFTYSLNTTYLIVVKYTIIAGTGNDTVEMFINPTIAAEPASPTVTAPDVTASDISPASVALRQGTASTHPTLVVDGIRIGTSWDAVMAAVTPADAPVDLNGDGKTDYVVVRNTGGGAAGQLTWYWQINGGAPATGASDWGLNTDELVPADYDGDMKDDIAVWRPGAPFQAAFYILQSGTNTVRIDVFGQTGDDPTVVADYNGDGKDDVAVYRPGAQSTWFYKTAAAGPTVYVPWGTAGDRPTPGDFNGDGTADFGIARAEGQNLRHWRLLSTGATDSSILFGLIGDLLVTGDFDGDSKTDTMAVRSAGGFLTWYLLGSAGGSNTMTFGLGTDIPVPGDYNGDGRTDIAVFRNGVFYSHNSTAGTVSYFQLGSAGDRVPAEYNVH